MTMLFGGRSPTGSRRVVIIILMVGFAIVGLSRIGGGTESSQTVEQRELAPVLEADPRGPEHAMMVSGLGMLQAATSFRFMYASGSSWTSGVFVAPDRVDQRVIIGRTTTASTEQVRRIGDETWVRRSDSDGWDSVSEWAVPADPAVLSESVTTLAEYAREVHLAEKPRVARTPSGDRVPSHRLSGMVKVAALSRAGLVPQVPGGIPVEGVEVSFEMLVERETGFPVEILFKGIPPAHPPLAVLHIFDLNSVESGSVVKPEIPAQVDDGQELAVESVAPVATSGKVAAAPTPLPPVLTSSSARMAGGEDGPSETIYAERVEEGEAGEWMRYVLPTEGYSVAAPTSWVVSLGREGVEVSGGRLDGIHGVDADGQAQWSIFRIVGRGALLSLGQRRVDSIVANPVVDPDSLGFATVELPAGPVVRIEYRIDGDLARWVCEYIVVRGAPALSSNLGYNIELSTADEGRKAELEEIAATFSFLTVGR